MEANGFDAPIVIYENKSLGIRVPDDTFSVRDVKKLVGSDRSIDVIDVNTQHGFTMTMREWHRYYSNNKERARTLNVLSLEFSHSPMDEFVDSPHIVCSTSSLEVRVCEFSCILCVCFRCDSSTGLISCGLKTVKMNSERRPTCYRR